MYESEALGGKVTIRTLTPYDAEGPLKLRSGKVTDLAAVVHARMCVYTCHVCMHVRARTRSAEPTGYCIPPLGVRDKPQPFAGTRR